MFNDFETNKSYETVVTAVEDSSYHNDRIKFDYDDRFITLPEAYDIFQNISFDIDKEKSVSNDQKQFAKNCLNCMEKLLKQKYTETGITKVLPKLYMDVEEDEALTIHWDYINYRIYLDIEKDISKSFYGIISKNAAKGFSTSTGQLNDSNYEKIVKEIIVFVFLN